MKERIKELAEQAGMHYRKSLDEFCEADTDGVPLEMMTRFAELVAAAERESCAKLCATMDWRGRSDEAIWKGEAAEECAAAIRAKGDKHE